MTERSPESSDRSPRPTGPRIRRSYRASLRVGGGALTAAAVVVGVLMLVPPVSTSLAQVTASVAPPRNGAVPLPHFVGPPSPTTSPRTIGISPPPPPPSPPPPIRVGTNSTPGWTLLSPNGSAPPTRQSGDMAYDDASGQFVMFGGATDGSALGDTWTFAAGNWTSWSGPSFVSPSPRWYYGMAYDPEIHEVVLFGGRDVSTDFNDTWTWNGTAWSQVVTSIAPPPMTTSRMVWDAADGYVVLTGGYSIMPNAPSEYDFVWTFNGRGWTNITSTVTGYPAGPHGPIMSVYDPAISKVVLFGANIGPVATSNNSSASYCASAAYTWTYVGGTFVNVSSATGSPPVGWGSRMMGYSPGLQAIVLFGGWDGPGCPFANQTWEFQGSMWSQLNLTPNPGELWDGAFASDYATDTMLLYSGNLAPYTYAQSSQTWEFTG